jgi:2-polyprenyl-3-methyl-5-hydroxy-6-metoxy-1,4-benzoquinol methylase
MDGLNKIYYLIGTTATGKTTTAKKLAKLLNAVLIESDLVYRELDIRFDKLIGPQRPATVDPDSFAKLSPQAQLFYHQAQKDIYRELFDLGLKENPGATCILVEGACCSLLSDRAALLSITGWLTREVFLLLDLPFNQWLEFLAQKTGENIRVLLENQTLWMGQYERFRAKIVIPPETLRFCHPDLTLLPEPSIYQRAGLTDEKWKLFDMPASIEGCTVADLGCNEGMIGKFCLDRGAKQVLGIDVNWRLLDKARDKGIKVMLYDLNNPFSHLGQFDYIFSLSMIHYIRDMELFIRTISYLTRKEFILEAPIAQNGQDYEEKPGSFCGRAASKDLIEKWLHAYFADVKYIGESISPDAYTKRAIWKATPCL